MSSYTLSRLAKPDFDNARKLLFLKLGGVWHGRDIMREGVRYGRSLLHAHVARLTGYVPIRALGKERLEAVQLARVVEQGPPERMLSHVTSPRLEQFLRRYRR